MKRMNLEQFKGLATAYVNAKKQADPTWTPSFNDITNLINKIMKEVCIDGIFADKLPELDGDVIEFGQAIEEYYAGLVPVQTTYADDGSDELKPSRPDFDDAFYSEKLGKVKLPTTIDESKYQDSVNNTTDYISIVNLIMKRLYDALAVWRYNVKKQGLGRFISKALALEDNTGLSTFAVSTAYSKGARIKDGNGKVLICIKAVANTDYGAGKTLTDAIDGGSFAYVNLSVTLAKPVDTSTGEAFIKAVKNAVEDASFVTEGTSLAGTTIGASEGLKLYILKGIKSSLDVDTLAGAFNQDKLAIPAEIKEIDGFGDADSKVYAVLVDARGIKLHNNYRAVRETLVGSEDYRNFWLHNQDTLFVSQHTFIKVFKTA